MYSSNLHQNQLPLPQNKGTFILHSPPKRTETHPYSLFSLQILCSVRVRECEGNKGYKTDWNLLSLPSSICRIDCFRSHFLLRLFLSSHQGRGEEMLPAVHFINFSPQTHNVHTPHVTLDNKTRVNLINKSGKG